MAVYGPRGTYGHGTHTRLRGAHTVSAVQENAGRCRNGNERAQPSGSSWRPSRVAARLYCSNKSYHPAITAPITSPRDEYILACAISLSLPPCLTFERASTLSGAAVPRSIRAWYTLSAPSSPQIASRLLFLLLFLLASHSLSCYGQRARFFLVLPSTPRRNVLIRLTVLARHAFRLIPLLYRVTADRSHILGRRISKLETCRENQPASRTFAERYK